MNKELERRLVEIEETFSSDPAADGPRAEIVGTWRGHEYRIPGNTPGEFERATQVIRFGAVEIFF